MRFIESGEEQEDWLDQRLTELKARRDRVIVVHVETLRTSLGEPRFQALETFVQDWYNSLTVVTATVPDSLFRIGSVSKTFTAAAIMKLVEQGKIQLGQSAFALLPNLSPVSGATLNSKLANVTVEDLLNMTGGWVANFREIRRTSSRFS